MTRYGTIQQMMIEFIRFTNLTNILYLTGDLVRKRITNYQLSFLLLIIRIVVLYWACCSDKIII